MRLFTCSASSCCCVSAIHDDGEQCDNKCPFHVVSPLCPCESVLYQIRRWLSSPNQGNQGINPNPSHPHVTVLDAGVVVDLRGPDLGRHFKNGHGVVCAMLIEILSEFHRLECVLRFSRHLLYLFGFVVGNTFSCLSTIPETGFSPPLSVSRCQSMSYVKTAILATATSYLSYHIRSVSLLNRFT